MKGYFETKDTQVLLTTENFQIKQSLFCFVFPYCDSEAYFSFPLLLCTYISFCPLAREMGGAGVEAVAVCSSSSSLGQGRLGSAWLFATG